MWPAGSARMVGWLEFNVLFPHKYGYIRNKTSRVESCRRVQKLWGSVESGLKRRANCVNRSQPLVGWGHLEDILLLNKFFSDCALAAKI